MGDIQSLRRLSLKDCRAITDFSPLAKLSALTALHCANTQITDLTPLTGMSALQFLDLSNTQVADIAPLAGLTELTELDLSQTQVSDLSPLARLHKLIKLQLGWNRLVSDIKPLARLTALKTLHLDYTSVSDLGAVAEFTRMMDQWTDKNDPEYEEYDADDEYYEEHIGYDEDRRGLHYDETPVAAREPYCWLVGLHSRRRTVETINLVRRTKTLPPHQPEGYEPPEAAESQGTGGESKELIDRVHKHMAQLEQAVRESKKGSGAFGIIGKGALGWLGAVLAAAAGYGVCFIVKAHEAAVRTWIDQMGARKPCTGSSI